MSSLPSPTPSTPFPARKEEDRDRLATSTRIAFLALVLGVGGLLRLGWLGGSGPILWDDAYMHLEARFFATGARAVAESVARKIEEARTGRDVWKLENEVETIRRSTKGQPPFYGRPLHNLVTMAGFALVGDVPFAGCLANAILGWLTIPLVWRLGSRLAGERAGMISSTALALSGYHVQYSREAFSEGDSLFFLAASLVLYLRSRDDLATRPLRGTALAGIAFGATILCHARLLLFAPLLVLLEADTILRRTLPWRAALQRLALLGACAAAPLVAAEIPYYLVLLLNRRLATPLPVHTYLEQNLYQVAVGAGAGLTFANLPTYPYLFAQLNGVLFTAALVPALLLCIRRRGFAGLVVLGFLLLPLLLFSFSRVAHMRYGVLITFGACLTLGVGMSDPGLWRRLKTSTLRSAPVLAAVLAFAATAEAAARGAAVARTHYSYPEAMSWMAKHGGAGHVSTQAFVSEVYTGAGSTASVPKTTEELISLVRSGHRYLMTDVLLQAMRLSPALQERYAVVESALRGREPVVEFPSPRGRFLQSKFEMNFRFQGSLAFIREAASLGADRIRIYDIRDLAED